MSPSLKPPAPTFSTAQVAHAAGIAPDTLVTWIKRGNIELTDPEMWKPGRGREREFSIHRLLHIALVARLARSGMDVKPASAAALVWSDVGEPTAPGKPTKRLPGGLFPTGWTLFVVRHGPREADAPEADVINVEPREDAVSVYAKLFHSNDGEVKSVHIVDLAEVDKQVRQRLGIGT